MARRRTGQTGRPSDGPVRKLWFVVPAVVVVLIFVTVWIGWRGLQAQRDLQSATADVQRAATALRNGADATPAADRAADRTARARRDLHDPLVRAAGHLPAVGGPLRSATALAAAADDAIRGAVLPLIRAAGPNPADRIVRDGVVDLGVLGDLAGPAAQAAEALRNASDVLTAAPAASGLDALDRARVTLASHIDDLSALVGQVSIAAQAGPALLGIDAPQRFLVIAQNPAEARSTGGLVGGYVEVEADNGILRTLRSGSNLDLTEFMRGSTTADLGAEYADHYGFFDPTRAWVNSNVSPHFPYAAQTWARLWQRQTGEKLAGVMALDPIALSYLMKATGPVTLSDKTRVTAKNVVPLTLHDVYERFPADQVERKSYLQEISSQVAARLTGGEAKPVPLLKALGRASAEHRLLLWAADPVTESQLGDSAITGRLPSGRPAIGDTIVDLAGSKLDYYLDRTLTYTPGCSDGRSSMTLTLRNGAPASGLPEYVTVPRGRPGLPPGTNRMLVTIYLPPQSRVTGVGQDGKTVTVRQGSELGMRWLERSVTLLPGQSTTLQVEFGETLGASAQVERVQRPLVRPEEFTVVECKR